MSIIVIQTEPEFESLKDEWNSLLARSASHVPFLRHEFLTQWWSTLGGGEWDQGDLFIITSRSEENKLTGIAPLFLVNQRLMFLGSYEISDYLDLISPPELLQGFVRDVFTYLTSTPNLDWMTLDLYNLSEESPTIPILKAVCNEFDWQMNQEFLQPAPYLRLPSSWKSYLADLGDKYRQEIIRKNRKAENYFLPIDWYIVSDEDSLETELDDFLDLMADNADKAAFLTRLMISQIKTTAQKAFKEGWLQLVFLTVGDIKAAGYLNFDFDQKIWIYNSGINSLFENLSPGWVLLSKIIQRNIEEGKTEIDFMRGDEPYKYQFGAQDKSVFLIQIHRN